MDKKIKILVSGDVRGNFKQLFNKVQSINEKSGPFEMLFCTGEFFGNNNDELIAYKNGNKSVPVPTYILGPIRQDTSKPFENLTNDEICTNITFLGKRGLYTLSSGIKVAYLSGLESRTKSTDDIMHFDKDDVLSVRNSCIISKGSSSDYRGIDILITSQWPEGIRDKTDNTSNMISYLVKEIRPRYHFCGLNRIYYEPPPFRIPSDNTTQLELATRFIALGFVDKTFKDKCIYGLSLTPVDRMRVIDLIQKSTNEIKCPFIEMEFSMSSSTKRDTDTGAQYFYDLNSQNDDGGGRKQKTRNYYDGSAGQQIQKRQRTTIDSEKCWFCLSSPNVEKHLVISIGDAFYMALAKGSINATHVLILPINHIQKASLLANNEWTELEKCKESLKRFFAKRKEVVCFFERNYKTSHLQINAVSLDAGLEWKIQHTFRDKCEEYNMELETIPKITDPSHLPQQGSYFVAELPDNTALITRQMKNFPLHFARDVFCSENLLNCVEKVDWRECNVPKEEEIQLVNDFREQYKTFDFTLH